MPSLRRRLSSLITGAAACSSRSKSRNGSGVVRWSRPGSSVTVGVVMRPRCSFRALVAPGGTLGQGPGVWSPGVWSGGHARRRGVRQRVVELAARTDAELGEDVAQMPLDGARADEQLRADLGIRAPIARQAGDLRLLRGELVARLHRALADGLTRGEQLAAGALGERF